MNKHLKNLNRIEFVVTMACSGKCKHCSQGDHKSNDKIDKDLAADAVRKIAKEYNIQSVMTFGGEPLLCHETVCEIHKAAREMDIPQRQLITNGYFSKDFDKIKLVAQKIIESGVNEILLSADGREDRHPMGICRNGRVQLLPWISLPGGVAARTRCAGGETDRPRGQDRSCVGA